MPINLPDVPDYEPRTFDPMDAESNPEAPLSRNEDWVKVELDLGDGKKTYYRDTNTMPNWAGSCWYYMRYIDPTDTKHMVEKDEFDYWMGPNHNKYSGDEGGVDLYIGGVEHAVLHLLYSRFWHKFLYDIGVVPTKEPYKKRTSHGMILGEGGEKMSKSRGNVVNPNDIIEQYGADTMRTYIMFIGDFEKAAAWSANGVKGCKRFLDRVWNLATDQEHTGDEYSKVNEAAVHKAIKKVSEDIEAMKFNTAIAALMALVNDFYQNGCSKGDYAALLLMLSPFAPHMVEELWETLGFAAEKGGMACQQSWPAYDASKTVDAEVNMAVQVCGKLRGTITVPVDSGEEAVVAAALADPKVQKFTEGKKLVKTILVPNKLVNLIAK